MAEDTPEKLKPEDSGQPKTPWRVYDQMSQETTGDPRKELIDALQLEATKQGIKTIEQYHELARQERDKDVQPLVREYLERRLNKHLTQLEHVADVGVQEIRGVLERPAVGKEEHDGEAKPVVVGAIRRRSRAWFSGGSHARQQPGDEGSPPEVGGEHGRGSGEGGRDVAGGVADRRAERPDDPGRG